MNAYTYLVGWSGHGKFYYGAQWNKKAAPDDLWKTYFTSSNRVRKFREEHGEPDVIEIRKTFGYDGVRCRNWEERVLIRLRGKRDNLWLNTRVYNKGWFTPTGSVVVRNMKTGVVSRVTKDEFLTNPNLVGQTTGMVAAKNMKTGETLYVTREEYKSNPDLEHHRTGHVKSDGSKIATSSRMRGKVFAKNINGEFFHVTKEEFRTRGDLIGAGAGYVHSEKAKEKISKSRTGKPRPRSVGEAVSRGNTGMVAAKNMKTGVITRVTAEDFKENPDLVGPTSGREVPDEEKRRRALSNRGKTLGMVTCRDVRTGEKKKVHRETFELDQYLVGMRSRTPNLL